MKIVAGLGAVDDYIRLVEAGADEVFCGFVPYEWNKKYTNVFPLNRREVLYYNVQINSFSEMRILKKMEEVYRVPVTVTFNSLYYLEEQYEFIAETIKELMNIGFNEFIIADLSLILYLREHSIKCKIQLSGECAEINELSIKFFNDLDISRYIFHRKNTIKDMEDCIGSNEVKNLEYEAFILNERCHYTGAFCSSLHCDEMIHLCKMPYDIGKVDIFSNDFPAVDQRLGTFEESSCAVEEDEDDEPQYILGSTGCGICALKKLKEAGITHLKVVGRGNHIDIMEQDIKNLKKAIGMINDAEDDNTYKKLIKDNLFENKCSSECYY